MNINLYGFIIATKHPVSILCKYVYLQLLATEIQFIISLCKLSYVFQYVFLPLHLNSYLIFINSPQYVKFTKFLQFLTRIHHHHPKQNVLRTRPKLQKVECADPGFLSGSILTPKTLFLIT